MAVVVILFTGLFAGLSIICSPVDSAKILMFPGAAKSYMLDQACLAEELVSRGNEVYFVVHEGLQFSAISDKLQGAQIVGFPREAYYGAFGNFDDTMDRIVLLALEGKGDVSQISNWFVWIFKEACSTLLSEKQKALSQLEKIKADLMITDYAVTWKCPYLFSLRLGIPTIVFGSFFEPWLARIPYLPSHIPTYFLPVTDRMTFAQRMQNVFTSFAFGSLSPFRVDLSDMRKCKAYRNVTDMDSLVVQTSLWLYSTHLVLEYPRPIMPNVVHAGGMTAGPGKPLSGDILDIINRSGKGVILVSFGSMASHLPAAITQRFLAVFTTFPGYSFIWRFNNKDDLEFPANVITKEWLPQNDLLASDKVKVLVTHCGQRSLYEAIYHAKPLLGVPLLYHQKYNAKFVTDRGYGESIDIQTFTVHELRQKMALVLEDESYKIKMEAASEIFRNDPETPLERAVRMVEQVIKYDVGHLKTSAYDLFWYQYWMLDIAAVVCTVSGVISLCVSYRIVIRLWQR